MATYTTSSGFSDLVGSMVVTNNNVDGYTSNTQGAGRVHNLGGPTLRFSVTFTAVNRTYNISATANGSNNGYSGSANNNSPEADEESWSATASTAETADASTPGMACGAGDGTATKKAAS